MTNSSLRWLRAVTACLIAGPTVSSAAGGYGTIDSMPAGHFDERDLALLQDAVVGVLEDERADATRSWSNEKSGHSGKVTSYRAFQSAEGRPCKKVQIDNSAEGYKSSMRYDVCLNEDGLWRDAASGVPFGKARHGKVSP
jgi:surface antigen